MTDMITLPRAEVLQVLEALEEVMNTSELFNSRVDALKKRLAQPEQEPAPVQQEPVASCQHKRYSVDVHEQTGRCFDCGAEGRMRFVVGNIAPVLASMFGVSQTTISRIKRGESY